MEFLINEHRKIDELRAQLFGGAIIFSDITTNILEKNIYGVDLNEESVEIAKLSLWLRTAQKGRKLNTLSNNIKCGNSLIDDPDVAGDKAFNWHKEFPNIFKKKEKKAWHITTATHNSRYSQRMFDNFVTLGEPVWLSEKEEIIVSETIAEIAKKDELNIIAYNICGDHMHFVLVSEEEEVPKIVGKLKAMSALACNIEMGRTIPRTRGHAPVSEHTVPGKPTTRGHAPLSSDSETTPTSTRGETQTQLWTQKFEQKKIRSVEQLNNTIAYIRNNRVKHELPENKELSAQIKNITCTKKHAFRTEYNGGFDVVIGNPPYVAKSFSDSIKKYIIDNFESAQYQLDLYISFMEKGVKVLKNKGILSYIVPNSWLKNLMFDKCRKYVLDNLRFEIIIPNLDNIFTDASVDTLIFTSSKSKSNNEKIEIGEFINTTYHTKHNVKQSRFSHNDKFIFDVEISEESESIFKKVKKQSVALSKISDITRGINPYDKYRGQSDELIKNKLYHADHKKDNTFVPEIRGKHVNRYALTWDGDSYVSYGEWLAAPREPRFFTGNRIICRQVLSSHLNCTFIDKEFIIDQSVFIAKFNEEQSEAINPKFVLAQLTSKLVVYYFKYKANEFDTLFPKIKIGEFRLLPINIVETHLQKEFSDKANLMIETNEGFIRTNQNLLHLLQSKFTIEKPSKKLQNWHKLEFGDFIKELKKIKIQLSLSEEAEWMQYFITQKLIVQNLKSNINKTDKEIDQMVYELYGLTEEEIAIVENSSK